MDRQFLQESAGKLRDLTKWIAQETVDRTYTINCEDYYVDLGAFGERPMDVEISDYEVTVDIEDVFEDSPVSIGELDEIADQLDDMEVEEATLEKVLERMANDDDEQERKLGGLLQALVFAFRGAYAKVVAKLPYAPLPWPGALRDDIDYTAADFPLRYQPPPGFDWSRDGVTSTRVTPENAVLMAAAQVGTGSRLLLDNKGRVSWKDRGDDTLASGGRWLVFHMKRDGVPEGNSFNGGLPSERTPPRALDANGRTVGDGAPPWRTAGDFDRAQKRLAELRALAERQAEIDYDPLTVPLDMTRDLRVRTQELRVGDLVNGDFGRVKSVKRNPDDPTKFNLVFLSASDGVPVEETRKEYDWYTTPIATVDGVLREQRLPALQLFEYESPAETPKVDYDPLTVGTKRVSYDRVPLAEMRFGDLITGNKFGRLIELRLTGEDNTITMVMNSDGDVNTYTAFRDASWDAELIDVPNRDEIPTAFQLFRIEVPAPF